MIAETILAITVLFHLPLLMNSKYPQLGFLLLLATPVTYIGSGAYIAHKIRAAQQARQLFSNKYPYLSDGIPLETFIGLDEQKIESNLCIFKHGHNRELIVELIKELKHEN